MTRQIRKKAGNGLPDLEKFTERFPSMAGYTVLFYFSSFSPFIPNSAVNSLLPGLTTGQRDGCWPVELEKARRRWNLSCALEMCTVWFVGRSGGSTVIDQERGLRDENA